MTIVIDTGPLVALGDATDPRRQDVAQLLVAEPGRLVVPAPVTAEVDHLLGHRVSQQARQRFLQDLAAGRFEVLSLDQGEHAMALAVDTQYADLELGLAAASVVVLANRLQTHRLATFDHRCFRPITPLQGGAFTLLPDDAS